jgi:glycosyltransferase involved in cell wall biosynthesis
MLPNCKILKSNKWVEALIANWEDTKGKARLQSITVKIANKLSNFVGFDFTNFIFTCAAKRFSNNQYDVVVAFSEGVPTAFTSHFHYFDKIAWVHCDYSSYMKHNSFPNESAIYGTYKSIVCVSEYTKLEFCKHFPSLTKKVYALYNVLDTQMMLNAAKDSVDESCYTREQFNIVSIGGINVVKRFSKIPQIVRTLIDRGCIFRWYLIGSTMQMEEQTALYKNIKKYDVGKFFYCLGAKDNPYPYISQSDLLVNTSISEAAPYVINEAKILHTPVVCADFGSASEFINDGINGFIVPLEQMSDKIELLIKNKQEYNKIKEGVSCFVYENEQILNQVYSLLEL